MATNSSGILQLSQIQSELGGSNPISLSEYYKGGTIIPTAMGGSSTIPSSGEVDLSNYYNKPATLTYSESTSPLKGGLGESWNTGYTFDLRNYFPIKELQSGQTFFFVSYPLSGSNFSYYGDYVHSFTFGSVGESTIGGSGSKRSYRRVYYDGNYLVGMNGYYSGDSSKYKSNGAYIKEVRYE